MASPEETELVRKKADLIWEKQCSACHGVDGKSDASLNPKPRNFGTFGMKMGFFFGGDKMREGIYRTISTGKNKAMPAFQGSLKEEEIWSLVDRIERF
ncbi:cytochrome C [Leptospira ryugenii]|uniref:Cytochrome C n=1 Tax=Leptospira ryugenii TaxID=1917863 RepID=A0A2P2E0C8_9LEPT|nr:cytochrome c [Leptospira ryugenii]GBF50338.1 cytochrome C [Leptospira ryugenii]